MNILRWGARALVGGWVVAALACSSGPSKEPPSRQSRLGLATTPGVGPELMVDDRVTYSWGGPARSSGGLAVATGGAVSLVVWTEFDSIDANELVVQPVDKLGNALTPHAKLVRREANKPFAVASDGQGFVIVTENWAILVTAEGETVGSPIALELNTDTSVAISFDGSDYVVTDCIYARKLSPQGVLGPLVDLGVGSLPQQCQIATNNAHQHLLVKAGSANIVGYVFDQSLQRLKAPISISAGVGVNPAVASDGSGFLVAWNPTPGGDGASVFVAGVDSAGALLPWPNRESLASAVGLGPVWSAVWDGARYLVSWRYWTGSVFTSSLLRITNQGAPEGPVAVVDGSISSRSGALAPTSDGALLIYGSLSSDGTLSGIAMARTLSDPTLGTSFRLSPLPTDTEMATSQSGVRVVAREHEMLVEWKAHVRGTNLYTSDAFVPYARRFSSMGATLSNPLPGLEDLHPNDVGYASMVDPYMVRKNWTSDLVPLPGPYIGGTNFNTVYQMNVLCTGGGSPEDITTQFSMMFGGGKYVRTGDCSYIYGREELHLQIFDPEPLPMSAYIFPRYPSFACGLSGTVHQGGWNTYSRPFALGELAFNGSVFLWVWGDPENAPNVMQDVVFGTDGKGLCPFTLSSTFAGPAATASDGVNFLVAWVGGGHTWARRVSGTGEPMDPEVQIQACEGARRVELAFDGTNYVMACEAPNQTAPKLNDNGGLQALWLTPSALEQSPAVELLPVNERFNSWDIAATSDGRAMVGYARKDESPAYRTWRARARFFASDGALVGIDPGPGGSGGAAGNGSGGSSGNGGAAVSTGGVAMGGAGASPVGSGGAAPQVGGASPTAAGGTLTPSAGGSTSTPSTSAGGAEASSGSGGNSKGGCSVSARAAGRRSLALWGLVGIAALAARRRRSRAYVEARVCT